MTAQTRAEHPEHLVGIYYFSGWWREQPNKYFKDGRDWRLDYPERVPLLGEFNEQKTMDREILAASEYGVDFFQILWYPLVPEVEKHCNQEKLNAGLHQFMASPHNGKMKFTIEFVNHYPFDLATEEEWENACLEWIDIMKHPSYLRIGGRPVFKIYDPNVFLEQIGGEVDKVKEQLDIFRSLARKNSLPEPLIGTEGSVWEVSVGPLFDHFDFLSRYMAAPHPAGDKLIAYEQLIGAARRNWAQYGRSEKPYVPHVPAGWDPRPWKVVSPLYEMPTREDWRMAMLRVRAALDKYPNLGYPKPDGSRQKAFVIYAWNEFGEGGYVAPTRGEDYMKLEVIREVFKAAN